MPDRYVVERHTIDIAYGFRVRDTEHPEETFGFGLRRESADDLARALNDAHLASEAGIIELPEAL